MAFHCMGVAVWQVLLSRGGTCIFGCLWRHRIMKIHDAERSSLWNMYVSCAVIVEYYFARTACRAYGQKLSAVRMPIGAMCFLTRATSYMTGSFCEIYVFMRNTSLCNVVGDRMEAWAEDAVARCVCVLGLDQFGDYSGR